MTDTSSAITLAGDHDSYHSDLDYVSRSHLATFDFSRKLYKRRVIDGNGEAERDELRIGKGTHAIALRDTLELNKIVEIPPSALSKNGARVGNRFTRFHLKNRGKLLMLPKQFQLCQEIARSFDEVEVAKDPIGNPVTIGDLVRDTRALKEFEHRWNDILPCRLKADLVLPLEDHTICLDLKTARSTEWREFRREVIKRRLWIQVAHYSAGLVDKFKKPVRFVFVVVEKTFPHRAELFELDPETTAAAHVRRSKILEELKECLQTGEFAEPMRANRRPIRSLRITPAEMGIDPETLN